jgi:hypothetical protein
MASLILLSAIAFISSCTQPETEKKPDGTTSSESSTTADDHLSREEMKTKAASIPDKV